MPAQGEKLRGRCEGAQAWGEHTGCAARPAARPSGPLPSLDFSVLLWKVRGRLVVRVFMRTNTECTLSTGQIVVIYILQ